MNMHILDKYILDTKYIYFLYKISIYKAYVYIYLYRHMSTNIYIFYVYIYKFI